MRKAVLWGAIIIVVGLVWAGSILPDTQTDNPVEIEEVSTNITKIQIGVVSARWEDHPSYEFLTHLAEQDINQYCNESGLPLEFEFILTCADSHSKTAYEQVRAFGETGITMVTGLPWTTMLCTSRSWGEENGMVLMSTGSRGTHLRLVDHCFRLYPWDGLIVKPLVAALLDHGIEDVIVLRRKDSWSDDVFSEFKPLYESKGGYIVEISYAAEVWGDGVKPYIEDADEALSGIMETGTLNSSAVVLFGYDEAGVFIKHASNSSLSSLPWFGVDSTVNRTRIIEDAGAEAAKVSLISPTPVPVDTMKLRAINDQYIAEFGHPIKLEKANLYDSCWLLALTAIETNSTSQAVIAENLPIVASSFFGIGGPCDLDEYGDRAYPQYDYWEYCTIEGITQARKCGTYDWMGAQIDWTN